MVMAVRWTETGLLQDNWEYSEAANSTLAIHRLERPLVQ